MITDTQLSDALRKSIASRIGYYIDPTLIILDPRYVTTDILMFLEVGIPPDAPFVVSTVKELCNYQSDDGSWFGSMWETAEATRLLQKYFTETNEPFIKVYLEKGLSWIKNERYPNGSWFDEIWETLFAVSAVLTCKRHGNTFVNDIDVNQSISWLANQVRDHHLINYHFTGIYLFILCNYKDLFDQALSSKIEEQTQELKEWLLAQRRNGVWSREVYANCYASLGLISFGVGFDKLAEVIEWLIKRQNRKTGEWESDRREASSLATLVLLHYYVENSISRLTKDIPSEKSQLTAIASIIEKANDVNLNLRVGVKSIGNYISLPKHVLYIVYIETIAFLSGCIFGLIWMLVK